MTMSNKVVMEMAVVLATQKAAELGAVCSGKEVCQPVMHGISMSAARFMCISLNLRTGQQYLDSLGGAATTSRKEKYVEGAFW